MPNAPSVRGLYGVWLVLGLVGTTWALTANADYLLDPDSPSYVDAAAALARGNGFTHDGRPIVFRTPGYPILLTPLVWVAGSKGLLAVPVIQLFLVGLVGWGVYSLTRELLPDRPLVAQIALALVLFSPTLWFASLKVLSDVLFAALLLFAVRAVLVGLAKKRCLAILGSGVLMTAAAFVRPVGLYLPYLFFPCLAIHALTRKRFTAAGLLALCLLGHVVATQAWTHRNRQLIGHGTFATVQEVTLYEYIAASIHASTNGENWQDVRAQFRDEADQLPESQRYGYMKRRALDIIADHPLAAFKVWLKGAAVLLFQSSLPEALELTGQRAPGSGILYQYHHLSLPDFARHLWRNERPLLVLAGVGLAILCPFWASVAIGIRPAFRADALTAATLLGVMLFLLIVSSGPQTMARFRVPIVPFAAVFAAMGLDRTWAAIKNRKRTAE